MIRSFGMLILVLLLAASGAYAQTVVNSLSALKPYLDDDNVNVKLAAGTYTIDAADIASGAWGYTPHPDITYAKSVMLVSGSNSIYDFTDVTILFNSDLFTTFGNVDVWELHVTGSNTTVKNLTMVDNGTVDDAPRRGVTNVVIDGANNVVEGFHVTAKGSFPYAYGDSFGKGSGSTIRPKKHSGILIRGDYNTLRNTTLIQRAFGHCLFMQAANHPTIEGCYVEGEMRSTDDMWTEEGTGSPADQVNFMTVWGYELPRGYMKALCEEGIRSYNAGETIINGQYISARGTNDITLKNTTVKNARGGCSIVLSSGTHHVEGITLLGCEFGFSPHSTQLINCAADAIYGPAYMNAYDDKRNTVTGDLTILPPSDAYYNGSGVVAFFGGENGNITLHNGGGPVEPGLEIRVGGQTDNVAQLGDPPHTGSGNTVDNRTLYPVVIASGSNNNNVTSCGAVTDNGSSNTVSNSTNCGVNIALGKSASQSSTGYGGVASRAVDGDTNGAWSGNSVTHTNSETNPWWEVDLSGDYSVDDIVIYNRTDNCCKSRLSNFTVSVLDGSITTFSQSYTTYPDPSLTINVGGIVGNKVRVQLNDTNPLSLAEVEVFGSSASCATFSTIQAESFTSMSGIVDEGTNIGYIHDGDWAMYSNVNLTCATNVDIRASSKTSGGNVEVRLGSPTGTLIGTVAVTGTGNWGNYSIFSAAISGASGVQDVYLVFTGGSGYLFNVDWFEFSDGSGARRAESIAGPKAAKVQVYPNPVRDQLKVDLGTGDFQQYVVCDLNGKAVRSGAIASDLQHLSVDVTDLHKGIYLLNVIGNTSNQQLKVVKY
ncbi:putative secreted protein (Por secretion system target) [Marinoscillum furvescens DSM 4134]|uniref:Putative secreted protein (Por secretion system target) n=2 Tax=Marinoscillum furvescens TaxID=1026 RepID=A0A3D9KZL7_MARFU|nr:putative secreted protein (Por secretion system target) [Marinoscillum furvescens DSM 4134]